MVKNLKQEILEEMELATMMASDIDKIYKKYTKSATATREARNEKIKNEKYHGCETAEELHELLGYGDITCDEYREGLDFLEEKENRRSQLSLVELHRKNLKNLRDRWKGTIEELKEELDELNGVVKDKRTYVEKLEAEERAERYNNMLLGG